MRRVFFSFDFDRDAWRAGQVRNSGIITSSKNILEFVDAAEWEAVKRKTNYEIEKWIDQQLANTSVTAVLIGSQTSNSYWVKQELIKSWERGNGILGIYIHKCLDRNRLPDNKGSIEFGISFKISGIGRSFQERFYTYDWVDDNGRLLIDSWIEKAAQQVGR